MTSFSRSALTDFDFGSAVYAGATVTAYTVDTFGNKTAFLATLYADLTSATLLENPQILDGFGQWVQPIYIDNSVVLAVTGAEGVPDHQTGVISANLAGSAAADAAASAATAAALYGASNDIYALVKSIYQKIKSQVFPSPLVALKMLRVKADASGYELRTPAQVQGDLGLGFGAGLKSDGAGNITMDSASATYQHAGRLAQAPVIFETGAVASGTTIIPQDDTTPQNTEGDQYMSATITPTNAASTLIIDGVCALSSSIATLLVAALFQDTAANALACISAFQPTATGQVAVHFRHKMTAGTTSATTFKVRCGGTSAGTTTFNGAGALRLFGGAFASSITITEILP